MIPKISVVVPVYNVESYLGRCVDSILEQTYQDFEIILVNDGSTDSSGKLCDSYAERYSIIKAIHKENKGPSDTRNVGIKSARGEYIYFLDSDDYIIRECLEILYKNAINGNADLSCGDFGFFDDEHPVKAKEPVANNILKCNGKKACLDLLYGKKFYTSSCNMLIRSDIARNNLFPTGKYHEDEMTTFRYFLAASNVVKTKTNTYYYYQRQGSIMHSSGQQVFDEALAGDYYVDTCKEIDQKLLNAALCKKYFLYMEILENYPQLMQENPMFHRKLMEYVQENVCEILLDRHVPLSIKKRAWKYFANR